MVYAKFGGQTECIMGNSKIENVDNKAIDFKTRLNVASLISAASDCAVSRARALRSIEKILYS